MRTNPSRTTCYGDSSPSQALMGPCTILLCLANIKMSTLLLSERWGCAATMPSDCQPQQPDIKTGYSPTTLPPQPTPANTVHLGGAVRYIQFQRRPNPRRFIEHFLPGPTPPSRVAKSRHGSRVHGRTRVPLSREREMFPHIYIAITGGMRGSWVMGDCGTKVGRRPL